jgi:hemerythrin superfamily protein
VNVGDHRAVTATALLTADHDVVRQLKTQFEAPGMRSTAKRTIAQHVFRELELHATIEEKIFYPAVATAMGREAQRLIVEAIRDHTTVKNAVAALKTLALADTVFDARFMTMLADVERHASEEEREMFPRVEAVLGAELEALGARMAMLKNTLLTAKLQAGAA